jgi:predicted GNAT family acetyltransferase
MSEVRDDPAMSRFELSSGGAIAFMDYRREGDRILLTHTEVPEALSGQGVGSKLVRGVLDHLRVEGMKVVPRCEFVAAYVERHPKYRDLLADRSTDRPSRPTMPYPVCVHRASSTFEATDQHRHIRPIAQAGPIGFDAPDAFLLSNCAPQESMGLFNLDGFLTDIVVSPKLILPSEWPPSSGAARSLPSSASRRCARSSGPS